MTNELIKLKVKAKASKGKEAEDIETYFISACQSLDASIFEPFIEEDQYFEEMDKYRFLASLKQQFDWAKKRGSTTTNVVPGRCQMCQMGASVKEFYGEKNTVEFAYAINKEEGQIVDIFLCNYSTGRARNVKGIIQYD